MRTQKKGRIAFAVCGSFCTLEAALAAAQQLTEQGWELLPIMSFAAKQDTRFGTGQFWQDRKSTRLNSSHDRQSRMPSSA